MIILGCDSLFCAVYELFDESVIVTLQFLNGYPFADKTIPVYTHPDGFGIGTSATEQPRRRTKIDRHNPDVWHYFPPSARIGTVFASPYQITFAPLMILVPKQTPIKAPGDGSGISRAPAVAF
jgi:hypothetical protein